MKELDELHEISEEDSFADGIESVKGEIEQTEGSAGEVEEAKNIMEKRETALSGDRDYHRIESIKKIPVEKIVEDYTTP